MKLNCAIIDDDVSAVEQLRTYVEKTPELNLIGAYTNAVDAMSGFKSGNIDLLFLAIHMSQLSGLEFAKIVPSRTKIIFVTAYKEYAIEGYRSKAIDYLLKPVYYEDFHASVKRAMDIFAKTDEFNAIRHDGCLFVKNEYKFVRLRFEDIQFIEGLKDYVKFHLKDNRNVLTLLNMKQLEEQLPNHIFKRVHRSYIANFELFDYTDKVKLYYGDIGIPISESYKNEVMRYLDLHML